MESSNQVRIPQEFTVERYEISIHPKMMEMTFSAEINMHVHIKDKDIQAVRFHMQNLQVQKVSLHSESYELLCVSLTKDPEFIDNTYRLTYDGVFIKNQKFLIKISYIVHTQYKECHGVCIGIDEDVKKEL